MPCCCGQPLASLGREVPHGWGCGVGAEPAGEVADAADAAGGVDAHGEVEGEASGVACLLGFAVGGMRGCEERQVEGDLKGAGSGRAEPRSDGPP